MKKILSIIFIMSIIISGTRIPFYAQENVTQELVVYEDASQYDEINAELEVIGREIINNQNPNARAILKIFNVTKLQQFDSRWEKVLMKTRNLTIGDAGCCLTSFTMIRNYLSGTSDTPADVNSRLGNSACPFHYYIAADCYGYTVEAYNYVDGGMSDNSAVEWIIGAMETYNVPVLVGMAGPSTTHFVVAIGYNSANGIIIRDPGRSDYMLLSQYLNDGYSVDTLCCYSN